MSYKDGSLKELYRTEGWYAFEVFLSRPNGKYLVRLGDWHRRAPAKDHLAVAFYRDGKVDQALHGARLVERPSKARTTVSHYFGSRIKAGDGPKPELADWDLSFQFADGGWVGVRV